MESTLRPWLGIGNIGSNDEYFVTIELKYHGSIPAKVIKSNEIFSAKEITQAELLTSGNQYGYGYMIYPGTKVTHISNRNISEEVD